MVVVENFDEFGKSRAILPIQIYNVKLQVDKTFTVTNEYRANS